MAYFCFGLGNKEVNGNIWDEQTVGSLGWKVVLRKEGETQRQTERQSQTKTDKDSQRQIKIESERLMHNS